MATSEGMDQRQNPWGIRGVYNQVFQFDPLQSSTRSCEDKSEREYLPNSQQAFSPAGYETITFDVSSNEEVISWPESVFSFRLRYTCEANGGLGIADALRKVHLQEGGFHNCIRNFSIYAKGTGAPIEQIQNYNKYFNVWSTLNQSAHYVKNQGSNWLDSMEKQIIWNNDSPDLNARVTPMQGTSAGVNYLQSKRQRWIYCPDAAAAGTPYVTATNTLSLIPEHAGLNIGDVIYLTVSGALAAGRGPAFTYQQSGLFIVQNFTYAASNASTALLVGPALGADITSTTPGGISAMFTIVGRVAERYMITSGAGRLSSSVYNQAANATLVGTLADGDGLTIFMQPKAPFLDLASFPLLLLQGLEFRFELELPYRTIQAVDDATTSALLGLNYNYIVTEPRFYAMLYKPEVSVRQDMYALSASPSGITWAREACQVFRVTFPSNSSTELSAQLIFGFRSLIDCICIFQDTNLHEGNNLTEGILSDSHGEWINDSIYSVQAQIGSDQWPQRERNLTDQHLGKEYELLQMYFPSHNDYRFRKEEFMPMSNIRTGLTAYRRDSRKFAWYLNFATDTNKRTNLFTGVDTTNTPCDFRIKKTLGHSDSTAGPAYPGSLVMYVIARFHKLYNLKNAIMTTYK